MKTATVRDLRNHYTSVLRWVSAGEDVLITQRGVVIARLSPETAQAAQVVDWASTPEVKRDRSRDHVLSAEQSAEILAETAVAQCRLIVATSNLANVVDEAKRLSSLRTLAGGHRGFDILHVASALTLKATHFLTFDGNQKKLAEAEGLVVPL